MSEWQPVHIGFERDGVTIGGVEIWKHAWRRIEKEAVPLPHPSYPDQRHWFDIYEAGPLDRPIRFAASELSNGVWGFYVPS